MAKTFKNLPRPSEPAASKPTSARDFFDLSDEAPVPKKPVSAAETKGNTKHLGSISNTNNTGNTSNTGVAAVTAAGAAVTLGKGATTATTIPQPSAASSGEADNLAVASAAPEGVRQTFVLSRAHLERLRDYVHARRAGGEYTYSQKQALQEALDLLFADAAPAAPRPAQTRAQEQERGQRIRQGRQARPADR